MVKSIWVFGEPKNEEGTGVNSIWIFGAPYVVSVLSETPSPGERRVILIGKQQPRDFLWLASTKLIYDFICRDFSIVRNLLRRDKIDD